MRLSEKIKQSIEAERISRDELGSWVKYSEELERVEKIYWITGLLLFLIGFGASSFFAYFFIICRI